MIALLAVALAAADPPAAVVSSLETAQLVEACRGQDSDPTATFCTGYIIGAFDTLSLSHQICLPAAGASTVEIVAAARKYLRTQRKRLTGAPSFVVRDALAAAFPCAPEAQPAPARKPEAKPNPKAKAGAKPAPKAKAGAKSTPKAKAGAKPAPKAKAGAKPAPKPAPAKRSHKD